MSPKSGDTAEPSSDCKIEPSVPVLYLDLPGEADRAVAGFCLSCGLWRGVVRRAHWQLAAASTLLAASAMPQSSNCPSGQTGVVRTLTSCACVVAGMFAGSAQAAPALCGLPALQIGICFAAMGRVYGRFRNRSCGCAQAVCAGYVALRYAARL